MDSRKASDFYKNYEKASEEFIKSGIYLDDLEEAELVLEILKSINSDNEHVKTALRDINYIKTLEKEAETCAKLKNFEQAIVKICNALTMASNSKHLLSLKNQYWLAKKNQKDSTLVLYKDAYSNYLEADFEECISTLSQLICNDPNNDEAQELMAKAKKIKDQKELGNSFYHKQNFLKAYQIYRQALKIDPSNVKIQSILHHNLAATNYYLLDYKQGVKDATAALQYNPKYINALAIRAKCYFKLKNYKESTKDCKSVLLIESNDKIKRLLKKCRLKESNQLFIKEASKRANSNFMISNFKDCIFNCKEILEIKEIINIRKLLEKAELKESNRAMISRMLSSAQNYYKMDQYDMCVSECDKICEIQTNTTAVNLKEKALKQIRNHKNLSDDMIHANDLFEKKLFKECRKYCNIVLDTVHKVEAKRDQYKTEAKLLLEKIRKYIEEIMFQAKDNFNLENFDQCIINYESILNIEQSFEANSEIVVNDKRKGARKCYESTRLKNCIEECNQILEIKEMEEVKSILNKIKEFSDVAMEQAIRNFTLEDFDLCIKDCEFILKIQYSKEAEDYLTAAKTGQVNKILDEGLERARTFYIKKHYRYCINYCKKILKIKEVYAAVHLIKLSEDAIEALYIQSQTIKQLIMIALRFYEKEDYNNCLDNCYKVLNIKEHKEARNLIRKVNMEKTKIKQIHDGMNRANEYLRNKKYKECITECELILRSKDFEAAKILMKMAKVLMNEKKIDEIMERARRNFSQTNFKECIQYCQTVLVIDSDLMEATTLMKNAKIKIENAKKKVFVKNEKIWAELHFSKAQYKECIEKCFNILEMEELSNVRYMLENCIKEMEYDNLTNNCDILQVDKYAGKKAITISFRKLSLKYHPDKHSNATKEMQKHCEKIFKKLSTAYRELTK